ncbi:DUF349 domain-containing protein [Thalassotalea sp. G2M2-11]|uniref:DUF349 domain-containing protein n=1 Tax=Thalassotalea sp. G2M2-11 TaxID=2787627 RepID=UPI0019D0767A|nr:DUF349 domain-containing protein [Thalassotalea sp. G2M2-11]
MILAKLFKRPWQSKDSNVRITAINDELSFTNPDDKTILLTLLNEDKNELVRRSVLLKCNDIELWYQASLHNSEKKIREFAKQQIEEMLTGEHSMSLSVEQKKQLLTQINSSSTLESWLFSESDVDLAVQIFQQLAKPQLLTSLFAKRQQSDLQLALLSTVDEQELLEKLNKRTELAEVKLAIEEKIAQIIEQQQKPKLLVKSCKLVLAKLLALKDVSDYQQVLDKQQSLIEQWQENTRQFDCLTAEQQQGFEQKFQEISQQVEKILAPKAEAFEQQKIAHALEQQKTTESENIITALAALEQSLSNSIFEHNAIDETQFHQAIIQVKNSIEQSVISEKQQQSFSNQLVNIESKLSQLPEIAASVTEATHLISKISQLSLPKDLSQAIEKESVFHQWRASFQQVKKQSHGTLPESITNAYQELSQQWQQALAPFQAEQKKLFHQVQRKLADVKRLIHSGKFNAAFGVFNKADSFYKQLSDKQQVKLARDYQFAQEKLNELSDWEHYIATPRKQALLDKVNVLVEQPCDNPLEQAEKVKSYRKQWNSLGHADDDIEQKLNHEFNQLCEQAFAPCRLYYAEQEKIRAQHLVQREALLEEIAQFSQVLEQDNINWKQLDSKLNQFNQKWRSAGEVEKSKYQALRRRFNELTTPLKTALQAFHQANIANKQQLIAQAQQCLSLDDITASVEQLKLLQEQWRTVGYCGPRYENKLWQEFRAINDQIFARRNEVNESKKQESIEQEQAITRQLDDITSSISDDSSMAELNQAISAIDKLILSVKQDHQLVKSVNQQLVTHKLQLQQQVTKQQQAQKELELNTVFTLLEHCNGQFQPEQLNDLSRSWAKRLSAIPDQEADQRLRTDKTIMIEILAGVDSPAADKDRRLALQVELMQTQMNSGQSLAVFDVFEQWLNLGQITAQDKPLLVRIKQVLLNI